MPLFYILDDAKRGKLSRLKTQQPSTEQWAHHPPDLENRRFLKSAPTTHTSKRITRPTERVYDEVPTWIHEDGKIQMSTSPYSIRWEFHSSSSQIGTAKPQIPLPNTEVVNPVISPCPRCEGHRPTSRASPLIVGS